MTAFPNSTNAPDSQGESNAINTRQSRADGIPANQSVIMASGIEYARLMKAAAAAPEGQIDKYSNLWHRVDAMERATLTARAITSAEAAIQAHLMLCGLECLSVDNGTDEDDVRDAERHKRRLEMAAQSLRLFLSGLAGESQPLEYRRGGYAEATDTKFGEG